MRSQALAHREWPTGLDPWPCPRFGSIDEEYIFRQMVLVFFFFLLAFYFYIWLVVGLLAVGKLTMSKQTHCLDGK